VRVDDSRAAQIAQTYGSQRIADVGPKAKKVTQRADGASLSSAAQELLRARRAAHQASDVRAALVADLRRQVMSGNYQVDEYSLATTLLPHLNLEA
jgi:flagellar biosynthesis anti-sigma factor FlgM